MFECRKTGLDFFDNAPLCLVNEGELGCTPERLFEIFEDPESWPVWVQGVQKVEWTSPKPYAVGTTRTVMFAGGMRIEESFQIWDHGKRMAFCVTGSSRKVFAALAEDYQVTDLGSGRCKLRWTLALDPVGFYRAIIPFAAPVMRWQTARVVKELAKYVEAEGRR
jgi:ribosome-associated toxin RatA of RatAB toxin-antitoxin module